jgi:hypothetical protein
MGGRAAHELGKAHEFTSDEARAAGAKGGAAVSADRDAHVADRQARRQSKSAESIMAKKGAASKARAKMPETARRKASRRSSSTRTPGLKAHSSINPFRSTR